jgi:putative tryptophan/tyrosine transport system substrate-binding protein
MARKAIIVVWLVALALALFRVAEAQQTKKVPRIGYVSESGDANNPGATFEVFRRGLRDIGYIEEKNILVEPRYAEGKTERVPRLVAELVQLKVDVLVVVSTPAVRAAKQATKTIPIVMVTTVDPVTAGLIDSLARPGGNVTGLTLLTSDLNGKRLELLKEIAPKILRVVVCVPGGVIQWEEPAALPSYLPEAAQKKRHYSAI